MKTKDFARTLRRLRQERGLSQKDAGALVGVTGVCISQWEAGRQPRNAADVLKTVEAVSLPQSDVDARVRDARLCREVQLRGALRMLRGALESIATCNKEEAILAETLRIPLGEVDLIDTGGLRALIACVEERSIT